jgi:hypothetical protein
MTMRERVYALHFFVIVYTFVNVLFLTVFLKVFFPVFTVHPLMLLMASLHLTEKQQHSGSSGATSSQTYTLESRVGREHFNAEILKT